LSAPELRYWSLGRDLNPGLPPYQDNKTPTVSYNLPLAERGLDWEAFKQFLAKNCCSKTVRERLRYARKYACCLFERDFSMLQSLSSSKCEHVLKALSALSKFLGLYDEFQRLVKAYGLKWRTVNSEDLIISRMTKTRLDGSVVDWIREVKVKIPRLEVFVDFALISGLRLTELIASWNLIVDLAEEDRLNEYYNVDNECLEHFRFKDLFIRRTKKCFITFIPESFIRKIARQKGVTEYQIANWIKRAKLKMRFGDIREYYATFMIRHLRESEINMLQGRVSSSVFMKYYFNPVLIDDLKQRVFMGVSELLRKTS